jgi:DnaJ-class molecular chaperone
MSSERPPSTRQDCLSVLGLPPNASHSEVKGAYRTLALKHHPDTGNVLDIAGARKFQQVTQAYNTLNDDHIIGNRHFSRTGVAHTRSHAPVLVVQLVEY